MSSGNRLRCWRNSNREITRAKRCKASVPGAAVGRSDIAGCVDLVAGGCRGHVHANRALGTGIYCSAAQADDGGACGCSKRAAATVARACWVCDHQTSRAVIGNTNPAQGSAKIRIADCERKAGCPANRNVGCAK